MDRPTALFLAPLALLAASCHHAPPVSPTASPDLEARADQEAHSSAKDGQRVGPALQGVSYEEDQSTSFRVPLQAGNCYFFGFAGDSSVQKFSIYIFSPEDKRLDSARGRPQQGVFKHCAEENGDYRVETKVGEGAGHYAVVVYATKGPDKPPPPPPVVKVDLGAVIEKQAASAAPGAKRQGDFFSGSADESEWYTSMDSGKCYWVIGAGESGKVKKLWLYLWDPQNKRITENRSDSEVAMVGHCPTVPGMYKFQAKVDSGSGPYKVGVYVK